MYVSCLRCHKTIKGPQAYSLWAHVESKRCYPENAVKGWRQQAKEKEPKAQIEEAHRATAKEAARKMQKARDEGQVPQNAEILQLRCDERLEEITTFETRRPKEEKPRVVKVRDDRARREEKLITISPLSIARIPCRYLVVYSSFPLAVASTWMFSLNT